jgi:hypothetical protein
MLPFIGGRVMGICGNNFENLFSNMAFGLTEKTTTVKHKCSKCGHVDEDEVTVARDGLRFGESPKSGLGTLCPWSKK